MPEWLEMEGLSLAYIVLSSVAFFGAIFVGVQAGKRWGEKWGWLAGIASAIVFYGLLMPAMMAIDDRACDLDPNLEQCH